MQCSINTVQEDRDVCSSRLSLYLFLSLSLDPALQPGNTSNEMFPEEEERGERERERACVFMLFL